MSPPPQSTADQIADLVAVIRSRPPAITVTQVTPVTVALDPSISPQSTEAAVDLLADGIERRIRLGVGPLQATIRRAAGLSR